MERYMKVSTGAKSRSDSVMVEAYLTSLAGAFNLTFNTRSMEMGPDGEYENQDIVRKLVGP